MRNISTSKGTGGKKNNAQFLKIWNIFGKKKKNEVFLKMKQKLVTSQAVMRTIGVDGKLGGKDV